jgi:glucarate dehydratase
MPLEAALRHATGAHWGRFVRTIVEVDTDAGITGLGEMGGGGESADATFRGLKPYLIGEDPFLLESLRFRIANPTASLYNNRTQLLAAIEFACLDIVGQALGVPVHALLGGKLRDAVPFASYLFFRFASDASGLHEVCTPEQLVAEALALKARHGFSSHKLKGGVFPPEHELACYRALAVALPGDALRYDPNAVLSVEQAIRFGRAIADLRNDYYEDPTWGLNGMRQVRAAVPMTNIRDPAVDVILLDTTIWGGVRACVKAAGVCETMQMGAAVHSSGELGVQLATMLDLGAVLPNLTFAADARYHHLTDDVIIGGKLPYEAGAIRVPDGPGLGVRLDRDRLEKYADIYRRFGGYAYDRDPARPGWFAMAPNTSWADPNQTQWFDGTVVRWP